MAVTRSAGILLFRRSGGEFEVLLGHMGGPFWARRDAGAWSVPKGELAKGELVKAGQGPDEAPIDAARREFQEELGLPVPSGPLIELGSLRQPSGKVVSVWALEADLDPATISPGTFAMEWPKGSGVMRDFPEIDRVEWFTVPAARDRLVAGQRPFLDRLDDVQLR